MISKKVLALIVVLVAVVGTAAATYALAPWDDEKAVAVEGGTITSQSPNEVIIRCLSPELTLRTHDYAGNVTICNSFPGSALNGYGRSPDWNGTTVSFKSQMGDPEYRLIAPDKEQFSFAVMGDSQGHNDILADALNMTQGCDFVIHCGDLTPSGGAYEFSTLEDTLNSSNVPVFTTPGNHDAKNDGSAIYASRFGPSSYSFDYSGIRFAFVDSSDLNVTSDQISWLEKAFAGAERKIIVTHAPCFDPIEGNHTLDPASSERLQGFALRNDVTAIFSGHVHAYSLLKVNGTDFLITGGAGGSLTNGTYHWVRVNVTNEALSYEKVDIIRSSSMPTALTIKGHGTTANFTIEDLKTLQQNAGNSSYQNQLGYVGGAGNYAGVNVSSLLQYVGDIGEGEILRITATDGYYQDFGYGNVHPNSTWFALQGAMILALSFDGSETPDWQDGPRIAMLPSDGLYDNSDCNLTSYPGQGFSQYPSAGGRWVKNVSMIEVVTQG
jgi:predicted phosphodiesterase